MKTTLPKLDRCQQAMERTLVQGNPVFVFLINMNKTCVPFSLFVLCTLVHWHARVFIFFVAEKHDIFSVQTILQVTTPRDDAITRSYRLGYIMHAGYYVCKQPDNLFNSSDVILRS
jgi:hypothetical protein